MAIFTFSTNMRLKKLVEDADSWWAEWEYNFERIDTHDHSPNFGKQLTGASLSSADDYYFGSITLNQDASKNFILLGEKTTDPAPADATNKCYIYAKDDGGDTNLWVSVPISGSSTHIQLTREGSLVSGPVRVWDTAQDHELKLTWNEDGAADYALNFLVHGADRTLDLNESLTIGNGEDGTLTFSAASKTLTVADDSSINQDVQTTSSPTFAGMTLADSADITLTDDSLDALKIKSDVDIISIVTTNNSETVTFKDHSAHTTTNAAPLTDTEITNKKYVDDSVSSNDEFDELTDVVGAYTTNNALYVGKTAAAGTYEETTVTLTEAANQFIIKKGTAEVDAQAKLTIEATSIINQDVTTDGSPNFNTVGLWDTGGDHFVALDIDEDNSNNHTLNFKVNDATRTIDLTGNLTVESTSILNQDLTTDASPTFAGMTFEDGAQITLEDNSNTPPLQIGSTDTLDLMVFDTSNGAETVTFRDDGARSASNAAPVDDTSFANKKYVDDQVATADTFLELSDTPGAFGVDNALYVANNTGGSIDETTVYLTEAANEFVITKGTAILTADGPITIEAGTSIINQDVTSDGNPQFTTVALWDTGGDHTVSLDIDEDNSNNHTLNFKVNDATRTIDLSGNLTVESTSVLNQDLTSDASPTFVTPSVTSIKLADSGADHEIEFKINEDSNDNYILNFKLNNGNRTLDLNESLAIGDGFDGTLTFSATSKTLTVEDTSVVNQDLTTDASPEFAAVVLAEGAAPASTANKGKTFVNTTNNLSYQTENSSTVLLTSGDYSGLFSSALYSNALINGGMEISQLVDYSSATAITGTAYHLDRWEDGVSTVTANGDQDALTSADDPFPEAKYSWKVIATSTATGQLLSQQKVEDYEFFRGKTVTASAWGQANNSNSYIAIYDGISWTHSSAFASDTSWNQRSVTKTISTSATALHVAVIMDDGAAGTVAITSGDYYRFTSATLNMGTEAPGYQPRSSAQELALCQRYLEKSYDQAVYPGVATNTGLNIHCTSLGNGANWHYTFFPYKVTKRTTPTLTTYDQAGASGKISELTTAGGWTQNLSSSSNVVGQNSFWLSKIITAGAHGIACHWVANAEI